MGTVGWSGRCCILYGCVEASAFVMRYALLALMLLLALPVMAGEVNISWNASEGATGYKVYTGEASGTYGIPVDVGNALSHSLLGLDNGCKVYFSAVTAYNIAGESDYSEEVAFIPRPIVLSIVENPTDANEWLVTGENFAPTATVTINGQSAPFTRDGCEALRIPVVEVPGEGEPLTMRVCNNTICVDYLLVRPVRPTGLTPS
jgi:hypothetical protein